MLIYVLRWWPSWISDQHKIHKIVEDLPMIIHGQFGFNCPRSRMATTAIHRLALDPMGKCSNAFFSGTTNMIKIKLYMNVHWMVLYKLYVFCSDMKFKMAATAGLSWAVWFQLSKWFQRRSILKHFSHRVLC
jgi:hypothetical protein